MNWTEEKEERNTQNNEIHTSVIKLENSLNANNGRLIKLGHWCCALHNRNCHKISFGYDEAPSLNLLSFTKTYSIHMNPTILLLIHGRVLAWGFILINTLLLSAVSPSIAVSNMSLVITISYQYHKRISNFSTCNLPSPVLCRPTHPGFCITNITGQTFITG